MSGWTTQAGSMVCLAIDNIDTDQIIPARFMSQPRAEGYAEFLLHDLRRDETGKLNAEFVLNQHPGATMLLAGKNFGSGSSREAAVYALLDSGIRVVIAMSFGDIFAANAINNGVLPAQITAEHWQQLYKNRVTPSVNCKVDLESSVISMGGQQIPFVIDDAWRLKLINGWDDTDFTRQYQNQIDDFHKARYQQQGWARPTAKAEV